MRSKRVALVVVVLVIGLLVAAFVLRFATRRAEQPAPSIDEIQAAEGVPVDVTEVRRGAVRRYLEMLGNVRGIEQVDITSSLSIDIIDIVKREGDRVRKGDVIIQLARDRHGRAYHQYEMAKEALELAENDLRRMENLHKEGAVSGQALEQARLAYRNAKSQFDEAVSVVDLVSPIDGVVTMINATVGSAATPGVPLATVAAIDRMTVRCYVGYEEVVQLSVGQTAQVETSHRTGVRNPNTNSSGIPGEITRVSLSSDPETNLFLVEVTVDNRDGRLRPGVVATVSVLVDEKTDTVLIPAESLIRREAGNFVYRVSSGRAALSPIDTGTSDSRHVEVIDGVSEGDTVVFRGQYRLSDGAAVKIHSFEKVE